MNLFLFAFLFLSQAFDVVPIIGKLSAPDTRRDGVGEDARFRAIGAMWNVGPDLYIFDVGAIRKLNLQTREVSTVTLRAGTGLRAVGHPSNSYSGLADLWSDGVSARMPPTSERERYGEFFCAPARSRILPPLVLSRGV